MKLCMWRAAALDSAQWFCVLLLIIRCPNTPSINGGEINTDFQCLSRQQSKNLLVDTNGEGSRQDEQGVLLGVVGPGVSCNSRQIPGGQMGCGFSSRRSKNLGVGGVWVGYGEELSVGLNEVLVNRSVTQEGKAGRRTADPNWGYCWRWKEHFEEFLNPTTHPLRKRQSLKIWGKPHPYPWQRSLR